MIDREDTFALLRRLVAIDSVNPSLVPGARGESEIARFVSGWLREHGVAAQLQQAASSNQTHSPDLSIQIAAGGMRERPNVAATIGPAEQRSGGRPGLLIVAHLDTVGAGDMPEPFVARERNARLYGRGALDIKSGVAAMCAAAASIVREEIVLGRPCVIAAVVDEECNSIGTEALLKQHSADAGVVIEPTDLRVCIAHKGYAWYEVTTFGHAAHGSMPSEGRDAIRMMAPVLAWLDKREQELSARAPHPLLGCASLHASLISGGQELSSYPAECRLQIERRTLPGESENGLHKELNQLLNDVRTENENINAQGRFISSRPAYEISEDSAVVQDVAGCAREVTGRAELFGMPVWTDAALLGAAGIPSVVFGPSGRGLHGKEEYVELESVIACAEVLRRVMLCHCRQDRAKG